MNKEVIDIEQWGRLLKQPNFKVFQEHVNKKLEVLRHEMESKYSQPSADRAYELIALTARIDELKKLFSRIEFKKHEYRQFEKEQQTNVRKSK